MIEDAERAEAPGGCADDGFALWLGFSQAHATLTRALDADLRAAHGVSLSEYEILSGLGAISCERMRMTALAGQVDLSPSGLSRAIERLEARGLVRREPCAEDRRGAFATLTDAGLDLVRAAGATYGAGIRRRFFDRLSAGEQAAMASAWSRLLGSQHACCGGLDAAQDANGSGRTRERASSSG